jgi:hypothetical protein
VYPVPELKSHDWTKTPSNRFLVETTRRKHKGTKPVNLEEEIERMRQYVAALKQLAQEAEPRTEHQKEVLAGVHREIEKATANLAQAEWQKAEYDAMPPNQRAIADSVGEELEANSEEEFQVEMCQRLLAGSLSSEEFSQWSDELDQQVKNRRQRVAQKFGLDPPD